MSDKLIEVTGDQTSESVKDTAGNDVEAVESTVHFRELNKSKFSKAKYYAYEGEIVLQMLVLTGNLPALSQAVEYLKSLINMPTTGGMK